MMEHHYTHVFTCGIIVLHLNEHIWPDTLVRNITLGKLQKTLAETRKIYMNRQ